MLKPSGVALCALERGDEPPVTLARLRVVQVGVKGV
jgi:hypothetical protein